MKFIKATLLLCVVTSIFISCNKTTELLDENIKWVYIDSANSANIKFIQVYAGNGPSLPTASAATTGPQVFIYANGVKLNGTSIGYGGVWPTPNVYAGIQPGTTKFEIINGRLDLTKVPNVPSFIAGDTIATFTANLDKGKFYSLYFGDSVLSVLPNGTVVPSARITLKEDDLIPPAYQTYKIRVANFLMNPLDTLSLFSARQNREIITDITHKNISNWLQLPLPIITDTLIFRKKGTITAYAPVVGFTPVGERMYTFIGRGKTTGAAGKTPVGSIITNR
jgi:hypothetical protein